MYAGLSRDDLPDDQIFLPPRDGSSLVSMNPLCRLRGFDAVTQVILDAMHTIGGVLKGLWCLLQGLRENARVDLYEAETNQRDFNGVHLASKCVGHFSIINQCLELVLLMTYPVGEHDKERVRLQLIMMAIMLPTDQAGARFTRLMTAAKKSRMHHMFVLAGTYRYACLHNSVHPSINLSAYLQHLF